MRDLPGSSRLLKSSHRGWGPADPVSCRTTMNTNRLAAQNDTAQDRQERRLQAAKRLLTNADIDAAVVEYCQTVLSQPGYEQSRAQASLDACSALLALAQADESTKRTREARQLLTAVSRRGGDC